MKKFLKNNFGFTLAEVLITAGIVSLIGLVAYDSLNKSNKTISRSLVSSESSFVKNLVLANMSVPAACEKTFAGSGLNRTAVTLYDRNLNPFLAPGQKISDQKINTTGSAGDKILFTIDSIDSTSLAASSHALRIKVAYTINQPAGKAITTNVKRSFEVDVYVVQAGGLVSTCFMDTAGMILKAVQNSCIGSGAVWNAATQKCTHDVQITSAVVTSVDANTIRHACPSGQFFYQATNAAGVMTYACQPYSSKGTCPAGSYMTSFDNTTGAPVCQSLTTVFPTTNQLLTVTPAGHTQYSLNCGTDLVLRKLGSPCVPKVITATCPAYQYISNVDAAGNVSCASYTKKTGGACPSGQYLKSINSDGSVPAGGCAALTLPANCPAQYVMSGLDGSGNALCAQSWP